MTEPTTPAAPEEMSDAELVEALAAFMGWEKGLVSGDGDCSVWVGPPKMTFVSDWNPTRDWNHWRQVEERLLVDNILTLAFFRYCKRGDSTKSFVENYMKADLPTRCRAALKAVRSSKPV